MLKYLTYLYYNKRLTTESLHWYVEKGAITQAQYDTIIAGGQIDK
jgi:hypothetical protein